MYRRVGWAWLALCFALALHVWDEAAHDFLAVYNPNAAAIRAFVPWLPIPQFAFTEWRNGLIVAVLVLAALSVLLFRGKHAMRVPAMIFAVIMIANGCVHIIGSLSMGRWMPGVYSSPLLIVCGVWLFANAHLWEEPCCPTGTEERRKYWVLAIRETERSDKNLRSVCLGTLTFPRL